MAKKNGKRRSGFASLSEEALKAVSAKGGKARSKKLSARKRLNIARAANRAQKEKLGEEGRRDLARRAAEERWRKHREAHEP